jgi:hypothetical protein
MLKTLLLSVLACGCLHPDDRKTDEGIASRYPDDNGIDKDPNVIFATGFEDGIGKPLTIARQGVVALEDGKLSFSGKGCAKITATKDVDEGGDINFQWDNGVDECYLRVYVRFDKDTLMPHHFINLQGHTPTYKYRWGGGAGQRPDGGKDGKVGTTLEPPKGDKGKWHFYSYWHEMHSWQTPEGKEDGRPNAFYGNNFSMEDSPSLVRDEWICVEMMLKVNSVGNYDGEQAFWINGRKVGHWKKGSPNGTWIRENFATFGEYNNKPRPFEGFNWRTDEVLKINSVSLQWYLSSDQSWPKMTAKHNTVYFDNLVISKKYIGPLKAR